jgi:hypothetical protein
MDKQLGIDKEYLITFIREEGINNNR